MENDVSKGKSFWLRWNVVHCKHTLFDQLPQKILEKPLFIKTISSEGKAAIGFTYLWKNTIELSLLQQKLMEGWLMGDIKYHWA